MIGDVFQPTHLLFILVVALLVLGPKRLPEVGRSLGKGIRDFRQAMAGIEEHTNLMAPPPPPPPTTAATVAQLAQAAPTAGAVEPAPVVEPAPAATAEPVTAEIGTPAE
jgi:sec-independent protein translocase protein TatA